MSPRFASLTLAATCLIAFVRHSDGTVTVTHDFSAWSSAAGPYTTLDFTGFQPLTIITTQYQPLGAVFTDGPGGSSDFVRNVPSLFPLDGWGLDGGLNDEIHISFSTPQYSFATHFTGAIQYWLYSSDELIYASPGFGVGTDIFVGLTSTQPFDRVVLLDPTGPSVVVDNIYFGPGIPAPGGVALFGAIAALRRPRRRS